LAPQTTQFVIFTLDERRHALSLAAADRVLPMVAVTPLPGAPEVILGMISLHGEPLPVVDLRRRLGMASSAYGAGAHLLIATTPRRRLSIAVDEVLGVELIDSASVAKADAVGPLRGPVKGIASLPDGLVLIHDLEALLSIDDERTLEGALATPA
jgi:purine-binding chemotaxis protein CheW